MKIKLMVSGGFIPVNKEAEIDADISHNDLHELISAIEIKNNPNARDNKSFTLEAADKSVLVNPDTVPEKYKSLFNSLTTNLKRSDK